MTENEQIQEMAEIAAKSDDTRRAATIATAIYNAGYRRVERGENMGTLHEVDEFICSKCGIRLQEWARIVTDEDGEEYHYEYAFKFCPNCGTDMH